MSDYPPRGFVTKNAWVRCILSLGDPSFPLSTYVSRHWRHSRNISNQNEVLPQAWIGPHTPTLRARCRTTSGDVRDEPYQQGHTQVPNTNWTPDSPLLPSPKNPQGGKSRQTHRVLMWSPNQTNIRVCWPPPAPPRGTDPIIPKGFDRLLEEAVDPGDAATRINPGHSRCQLPLHKHPTQRGSGSM